MRGARTLVTGAAGFAGSHLLDRLPRVGAIMAGHRPGGTPPGEHDGVTWTPIDLSERDAVAAAIRELRPTHIYHLAGAASVESSWRNAVPHLRVNALGTHHLLEAVRTTGHPCRVLVVTSAQVYQPGPLPLAEDAPLIPASPYGLTKLAQDQLAQRAFADDGLDVVIARPFNHAGPRQAPHFSVASFARQIARIEAGHAPPVLRVGNLDARRDITDVRDVADAYIALMEKGRPGEAYNVCSGRAARIQDLLDGLVTLSTMAVTLETDPDRLRPADTPVLQGDATKLRDETGWRPSIPIDRMLLDTLNWWRSDVADI